MQNISSSGPLIYKQKYERDILQSMINIRNEFKIVCILNDKWKEYSISTLKLLLLKLPILYHKILIMLFFFSWIYYCYIIINNTIYIMTNKMNLNHFFLFSWILNILIVSIGFFFVARAPSLLAKDSSLVQSCKGNDGRFRDRNTGRQRSQGD